MSQLIIANQAVYFDGYDLQGRSNAVGIDYSADVNDVSVLGVGTRKRTNGLLGVAAHVEGFLDADTTDLALFNSMGVQNKPFTFSVSGDGEGEIAYFFNAITGEISLGAEVGNVLPFKAGAENSGDKLVRGTVMLNSRAAPLVATGNGTARQLGAVASGKKVWAALHAWNVGTGSVVVKVKSDATNAFSGAETDRITFTSLNAVGSEIKSTAGAITDTWWKVYATISGASPSFKMICTVGII